MEEPGTDAGLSEIIERGAGGFDRYFVVVPVPAARMLPHMGAQAFALYVTLCREDVAFATREARAEAAGLTLEEYAEALERLVDVGLVEVGRGFIAMLEAGQ